MSSEEPRRWIWGQRIEYADNGRRIGWQPYYHDAVRVSPGQTPAHWEVRIPGSKSLTNRAMLLASVADGRTRLVHPLLADDTEAMAGAMMSLGATVSRQPDRSVVIDGLGGPPRGDAEVWCAMAGTVGRFAVPMVAAGSGRFSVDAHAQLRRRPLGPVLDALRAQGAVIDGDAFPLTIEASGLTGGEVEVDASVSSQFLSGLLMAAPFARAPTLLSFAQLVSRPYIDLTLAAMRDFGVYADLIEEPDGSGRVTIVPGGYRAAGELEIEPDASTASYFLAAAAVTASTVTLPGFDLDATAQGDVELVHHLVAMGATISARGPLQLTGPERLRGVHVDMGDATDVFMTLACVAPFADGPTTIEGLAHARVKESDRVAATAENLRRLGIQVDEGPDFIRIHPGQPRPAALPTYEDHRIAMAFSLIGLRVPVVLQEPRVVAKTCPGFFAFWEETGAIVEKVTAPETSGAQ